MAMGEHDACVVELFTQPNLDEQPLEPLPSWSHACLWGDSTDFYALHKAIIATDNWGVLVEVLQYHALNKEATQLQIELWLAEANLAAVNAAKDACEDWLVATRAVDKIQPVRVK
jgi:hypothetical protein